MLRPGAAVEAHDEVVPVVVQLLGLSSGLGQEECAPVADAAHHAARVQDYVAGCFGDSAGVGLVGLDRLEGEEGGLDGEVMGVRCWTYSFTSRRLPGRTCGSVSIVPQRVKHRGGRDSRRR